MEGGVIGYDSGTESGGAAYRFLGIGPQTQYSKDTVTVSLRAVSVNTGKVLAAITVTKIVYSTADSVAVLKYINNKNIGSQIFGNVENVASVTGSMFEAESGLTINEPGTLAVKATVEAAVVELIKEGEKKGVWDFKKDPPPVVQAPTVSEPVKVAPAVEVKKEEPKKVDPVSVDSTMYLAADSYIYKETNEKSQRTWWLKMNTELKVSPAEGDWVAVVAGDGKRGFVKRSSLVAK
jgi:curli biogenesis system outer membrane secretion channel CsgG